MDVPVRFGANEGRTRDLSSRGLYFLADVNLDVGTEIEIDVTLPHASPLGPLHLHLRGRIVRVDELDTIKGMAAVIETWEIADPDEAGIFLEA